MVYKNCTPWFACRKERHVAKLVVTVCALLVICINSFAQHEYLSRLDYNRVTLTRIGHIPGVTWVVVDNTTHDENAERFFFLGNATGAKPYRLFTVSSATGDILSSPLCPSNNLQGQIFGLQYDSKVDTLYALYNDNQGGLFFSWIEPATGVVHPIRAIPSFNAYLQSSFDKNNRWYICHQGKELIVIAAASGEILFRNVFSPAVNVVNMVFDNTRSRLYAVCYAPSWEAPRFDSISLRTGAIHDIAELPGMSFPQLNANVIDERNGRFVFVAKDPAYSGCFNNYLYQVDVSDGTVLAKELYPFAQNTSSPYNENALCFSYDQQRQQLFVLNWHPPDSTYTKAVVIIQDRPTICAGDAAVFTAAPWKGAVDPSFQWQVNGVDAGFDTSVLTLREFSAGDVVRCIMTNRSPCATGLPDTSNSITILLTAPAMLKVTIAASANPVCRGTKVAFTASSNLEGQFAYRWQVNGRPAGGNGSRMEVAALADQDRVNCLVTSNAHCVSPNPSLSNSIVMQVTANAAGVTVSADKTKICTGEVVVFTAHGINAGSQPRYQWQLNGRNVGEDSRFYSVADLQETDVVRCVMASSVACSLPVISDNPVRLTVRQAPLLMMGADTIITPGQKVYLKPGITGAVDRFSWTPSRGLDNPTIANPVAAPDKTTDYALTATSADGCAAKATIKITVYSELRMPSAFTPNRDGNNDVFGIPVSMRRRIKLFAVYNRHGERLFSTNDASTGWDGRYKGVRQPAGTYVWMIEYIDEFSSQPVISKGVVIMLR